MLLKRPRASCPPPHAQFSIPTHQAQSFELLCWPFLPGDLGLVKPSLGLSFPGTATAPLSKRGCEAC